MPPSERAALQQFSLGYIVDDHRSQEACKAVGNSMSVPVLAVVSFRELFFELQLRPQLVSSAHESLPRK